MRRRRWAWIVGSTAAVGGVLAGGFWFVFVPNWRPPLQDGERYGIDVSAHQGEVDWTAVAADGIEFAYVKATEGGDFVDERFATNRRAASAAGLDVGAYHFFTLCRPGAEQAANFLEVAPPDADALAPAVDLELAGNCRARPGPAAVERELRAFLEAVEAAWEQAVVVYSRDDWDGRYPTDALDRPRWIARFLRRPGGDWTMWQVHGFAHVEGVDGDVDLDVQRAPG